MKRSTRMLLMSGGKIGHSDREKETREHEHDRHRDQTGYGYDTESRFRDRRGREHYDDGRYAPMSMYDDGYRGYPYEQPPYVPPIYERDSRYWPNSPRMHRIGFAVEGEMERIPQEYGQEYRHSDERYRDDAEPSKQRRTEETHMPFTREIAMEWTGDMENGDGTKGPHWSMEQVRQVMEQRGIDCDPLQFFAVLNSVYSDYYAVAKKHGVGNKMDFYADLAKAWLEDPDAVDDKAAKYFEYIVKH